MKALRNANTSDYLTTGYGLKKIVHQDSEGDTYSKIVTYSWPLIRLSELYLNYAEALNNLGVILKITGKYDLALSKFNKALHLKPNYAEAYNNKGNLLKKICDKEAAIVAFKKAIRLKPDFAEAQNNLGVILTEIGKPEEAVNYLREALKINPKYAEALNNLGVALKNNGELEKAIVAHKEALKIQENYADAHLNLSFAYLNSGKLKQGLTEYEWRWKTPKGIESQRNFIKPTWDGEANLKNKRILIWSEQGIGETLNWSPYLRILSNLADHCILECKPKLIPLLTRSYPTIEVRAEDKNQNSLRNDFDYQLPLGSLVRYLSSKISKKDLESVFLAPDPETIQYWKDRLMRIGAGPYVGISWKSSNQSADRLFDSTNVANWSPIFGKSSATFINLQYQDFDEDLNTIKTLFGTTVHNFVELDHYNDICNVSALCAALDCVVSTKLSVPFISAGVGTPTHLAIWRQSPSNNPLLNPNGQSVEMYARNTWESWDNVFCKIATKISSLQYGR